MADIFVFGSNLAGRHGKGAALEAIQCHGAVMGLGWGLQGNSYAIPTKGYPMQHSKRLTIPTLPLPMIQYFCRVFLDHARRHPDDSFQLTAIGCGLAGYKPPQIAPFFNYAPFNVTLPYQFMY